MGRAGTAPTCTVRRRCRGRSPGPFRIWHGSATSQFAVDLAAKHGDPIVSANALQPRENYQVLIDRYREQYAAHGHDPAYAFVGSGSGGLFLADTTEQAIEQYRPFYEGAVARQDLRKHDPAAVGKVTSFRTIEEAVERGPALVGSPERVAEKILDYHASYRHDLQSVSINHVLDPRAAARRAAAVRGGGRPAGQGRGEDRPVGSGRRPAPRRVHRGRLRRTEAPRCGGGLLRGCARPRPHARRPGRASDRRVRPIRW